jgi:hypothetical protein
MPRPICVFGNHALWVLPLDQQHHMSICAALFLYMSSAVSASPSTAAAEVAQLTAFAAAQLAAWCCADSNLHLQEVPGAANKARGLRQLRRRRHRCKARLCRGLLRGNFAIERRRHRLDHHSECICAAWPQVADLQRRGTGLLSAFASAAMGAKRSSRNISICAYRHPPQQMLRRPDTPSPRHHHQLAARRHSS